jgi:hypothetical protein
VHPCGAVLDPLQYMILIGSKYDPNMPREAVVLFLEVEIVDNHIME